MRIAAILVPLLLGVALALSSAAPASAGPNCTVSSAIDAEEQRFLQLINEHRADNGLGPLALSPKLTKAAAWKSEHMAANDYFAHADAGIDRSFSGRIRDCGYTANTWLGENIAAGKETAEDVFDQWRNSSGHNANMLNPNFNAIGIGRAFDDDSTYGWYWTTDFGGLVDGSAPPPGSEPEASGDVNCTTTTDSVDAALVLQYGAGLLSSLACADNADVNGDGSINALDATLILQIAAGYF
ncbi:MAG: CAP domain-containing protein [Dehalococcoidia bacterium]